MTKKNENQQQEKNRLIGHLSYLPYRQNGYGIRLGPVFSTTREECKQLVIESIPTRLLQDMQRGELGSFFIWDRKDEAGA